MLFNIFLTPSFIILFLLNPIKNINKDYISVKINNTDFSMEVANTQYKKALGLMYKSFKNTKGMVFIYNKPTIPIYYNKNVKFPLRIYFLDADFKVVSSFVMQKNSFKTYKPKSKINYVVEVPLKEDLSNDFGDFPKILLDIN